MDGIPSVDKIQILHWIRANFISNPPGANLEVEIKRVRRGSAKDGGYKDLCLPRPWTLANNPICCDAWAEN